MTDRGGSHDHHPTTEGLAASVDLLTDDDVQLALFLMYELHYGGLEDVSDSWEWDPRPLAVRVPIERECEFEETLRRSVRQPVATRGVPEALFALVGDDGSPGLSAFVERDATAAQVREILACRSIGRCSACTGGAYAARSSATSPHTR
ncbi:hypothetical protein [Agromyces bauzanensis]|nr:hypothetical protein [Agromyces bauzanensis]